jgi:hypothetical protein
MWWTARDADRVGGSRDRVRVLTLAGVVIATLAGCGSATGQTAGSTAPSAGPQVGPAPAASTSPTSLHDAAGSEVCSSDGEPTISAGAVEAAAYDSSGLGWLDPLQTVTVVVEGRVESLAGPPTELVDGGAEMAWWAEDEDEWETPFGLPLMEVSNVEIVGGTADDEIGRTRIAALREQLAADTSVSLVFTNAIYEQGERYRFFLGHFGWSEDGRQAFSASYGWNLGTDRPAPGLERGGWEQDLDALRCEGLVSGSSADALVEIASAMYTEHPSGKQQEIRSVLGVLDAHEQLPYELVPDGYWPVMADERAPGVEYVEVDIAVLGAGQAGPAYGLRGAKILGWGHASANYAGVRGWIPPGETVELVTTDPYTDMSSVLPVDAGGTTIQLTTTPNGLFALVDLRSGSPAIHVYGSRMELHQHVGEELLPPPDTAP